MKTKDYTQTDFGKELLELAANINKAAVLSGARDMSYTDITKAMSVEPLHIMSSSLLSLDEGISSGDLNTLALEVWLLQYLGAIEILANKTTHVYVRDVLNQVNPNADLNSLVDSIAMEGRIKPTLLAGRGKEQTEAVDAEKMFLGKYLTKASSLAMESKGKASPNTSSKIIRKIDVTLPNPNYVKLSKDEIAAGEIQAPAEIVVSIFVRLTTLTTPNIVPIEILALGEVKNKNIVASFQDVLDGRRRFFRDFILGNDILDRLKEVRRKDKLGIYDKINKRSWKTKMVAALTGKATFAAATNVISISASDARQVEIKTGLQFDNTSDRAVLFGASRAMLMFVVDQDTEIVTIYLRGRETPTILTFSEVGSRKGSGNDLSKPLIDLISGMSMRL